MFVPYLVLEAAECSLNWHVDLASSKRLDGLLVLYLDLHVAMYGGCTASCRVPYGPMTHMVQ